MKVECSFCGNMINDTLEQCPYCGAPNEHVRRVSNGEPTTIDELKQWYADRGLPPYEVTRFFIGINYQKPRAFGIYKDENTGNFVVYKNKDTGARAVRYEGTDEAYAVNELLQRLKQEIIQQKMNNLNKSSTSSGTQSNKKPSLFRRLSNSVNKLPFFLRIPVWGLLWFAGSMAALFAALMLVGTAVVLIEPKAGYYELENVSYYRSMASYGDDSWFYYDGQEWSDPIPNDRLPAELENRSTSTPYFVQSDWDSSLPCPDFKDSVCAKDLAAGLYPEVGYYVHSGVCYYHLENSYSRGWYYYDGDWYPRNYADLPYELRHSSLLKDYYAGTGYQASFHADDFTETFFYRDYYAPKQIEKGYYRYDNYYFYHLADDYDDGWYYYEEEYDDWSRIDPEYLPEEFSHPSCVGDFYYTSDWDSATQFSDFTDTSLYRTDKDNWSDSSSDSDYSWSSSDSWDSGSSDWGSDW